MSNIIIQGFNAFRKLIGRGYAIGLHDSVEICRIWVTPNIEQDLTVNPNICQEIIIEPNVCQGLQINSAIKQLLNVNPSICQKVSVA